MAKKVRGNTTMIKMVSTALTGYCKWFKIPRTTPKLNLILYDPRAQRHCLFKEDRKRKLTAPPQKDFTRSHR
ncbi:54S ribosomal protein L39, mitochondrial [Candida viswanathii]|uniref:Large ribosomal subunit protein bL33m n=1 Tax=Candida viswanathii TaxID=5486 RepID=A0A367XVM8_9ASCO|nr:54S ribosomal protein L39, mitochondrial [Candida viswanathii]